MIKHFTKNDRIGAIEVHSFDVALQGVYVTLAFNEGYPFDMKVSKTADEAGHAHEEFLATARLMEAVTPAIKAALDKGQEPDVDGIVAGLMPPKGALLN